MTDDTGTCSRRSDQICKNSQSSIFQMLTTEIVTVCTMRELKAKRCDVIVAH